MITPDDFESVYQYVPAPRMPGVRKLGDRPEERYRLTVDLDAPTYNYVPVIGKQSSGCRRRPPVMAAGGVGIEPFDVRFNPRFLIQLLIIILIIWFVYNMSK